MKRSLKLNLFFQNYKKIFGKRELAEFGYFYLTNNTSIATEITIPTKINVFLREFLDIT
ncbi:MAG: hypothetical protein OEL82_12145 [Nitrosopumilus sp.]|nr:hypothetical protein [Nitrosopumilus sp.]